jgi:hypothetical protein
MNNDSLRRQLRELAHPSPSEAARDRAKHRALLAFQKAESAGHTAASAFRIRIWQGATALAVLAAVIFAALWLYPRGSTENLADDRKMLREVEQLFPHQLNAVVEKGGQTDLSLTQVDEVGANQPVLLIFKRQNEVVRVLSFSGHRVCVPLGAHEACFEVLETADGGVILEGDKDVLLASRHPVIAGYSLRARTLSL